MQAFQWRSVKTRVTLFALMIFVIGIWSLAIYASRILRDDMQRLLGEQEFSTATFVADEVNHEVEDRLLELGRIAQSVSPFVLGASAALQVALEKHSNLERLFNVGGFVTGTDGVAIAEIPLSRARVGVNYLDRDFIAAALRDGKAVVGRPVIGKRLLAPTLAMTVPIFDANHKVIGTLTGATNLGMPNFLDRIAENRYGKTGGYLLVAPQYRLVVTATDKRRAMEVLPSAGVNPTIDRFIDGFEGYLVYVNQLGEEMLTAVKRIPVAGWYLAIVLPADDAFAPIRDMQLRLLMATIGLTLLVGVLMWWVLQHQLSPMMTAVKSLAHLSDTNQRLQPLAIVRQDEIGELIGGFNRLLSTLGKREDALKESEARFRGLTAMSSDFYWESDAEHRLTKRTESERERGESVFQNVSSLGKRRWEIPYLSPDESGWQKHREVLDGHLPFRKFEISRPRENGTVHHVSVSGDPVFDAEGTFVGYRGVGTDHTERKRAEEKIKELAFFDQLTGLPNRTLLLDRLKQSMTATARSERYGSLLFIDLDNFKTLNDTLGHDMGDLLLIQVAKRLGECVRAGDTVARLGGDEFVVMLPSLSLSEQDTAAHTEAMGKKILSALGQAYQLAGRSYHSTPSIGITLFNGQRATIDDLMKQADLAMYKSKEAGRNTLRFFDPAMETAVMARAQLESDFRVALHEQQLILHYQAQVVRDNRVTGAEALVRWQHPQRGLVAPAEFIPLAEETGLIVALGNWVLETACTQLALWASQAEMAPLTVAVNVSVQQFRRPDFAENVLDIIRKTGANAQLLKLELTESVLVDNVEDIIGKMIALKAAGVGFSLDDFGTGYSSLSYLQRLPLDQLKIDESFVRDVITDPNDAAIAKTIVALAENLGLGVIAEGVETEMQCAFLANVGCHAYQGYYFSRPLPVEEFERFVRRG